MKPGVDLSGQVIEGTYRLDAMMGAGGMGQVYRGRHLWTDRTVAIKVLHGGRSDRPEVRHRFLLEAKAAAKLQHPNVVDVLDMGESTEVGTYLVMEHLNGESLRDRLSRNRTLHPDSAIEVLLPVADAIARAHENGIVHRDLKPDNIFISREHDGKEVPKLLDFGIAKFMEPSADALRTKTGACIGTPAYMSPEQVRGRDVGPATDVWAMGAILYECLEGHPPVQDEHIFSLMQKIMLGEIEPPERTSHPELLRAIRGSMAPDPAERFSSIQDFANALRRASSCPASMAESADTVEDGSFLSTLLSVPPAPPLPGYAAAQRRASVVRKFGAVLLGFVIPVIAWYGPAVPVSGQSSKQGQSTEQVRTNEKVTPPEPAKDWLTIRTDFEKHEYIGVVARSVAPDGEIIDVKRKMNVELPITFELTNNDPRDATVEASLIGVDGAPIAVSRDQGVSREFLDGRDRGFIEISLNRK